jgi:ABC-type sugar transport system ATPase subunit
MLEIRKVTKRYGVTTALEGLDLRAARGEILGVAGPNGAGKSTLVRLVAGEDRPSSGEILFDGQAWKTGEGVAVVHQEPQLFPNLTVGQNLLVGRENSGPRRPLPGPREVEILTELELDGVIDIPLGHLPLAAQQRTEIARALVRDAQVVLFDEPNSALTEDESERLFARMRMIADAGRIVLFVSHRLSELVEHCDRVAVIRDGRRAALLAGEALTAHAIARELVVENHSAVATAQRTPQSSEESLVELRHWRHRGGKFDIGAFCLRRGEIAAIVGVEGSGSREFVASVAGNEPAVGDATIGGVSGRAALRRLTAYIPASRRSSLFPNFTVAENAAARLGRQDIGLPGGLLSRRRINGVAQAARSSFGVRCASVDAPIGSLSGGNQQKVAIAAALAGRPFVLVAEEPTRGVDVGAKAEIYRLLAEFAASGNAVLVYCTEVTEVYELAATLHVMDLGQLSEPLAVADFETLEALAAAVSSLERHAREAVRSA